MKVVYKSTGRGLDELPEVVPNSWIHFGHPSRAEALALHTELGVPESFLTAALDADELARFDRENGCVLIVVLVPHHHLANSRVPYSTAPLGIVLTEQHLVTITTGEDSYVRQFAGRFGRQVSTAKRNRLVLQIFLHVAQMYLSFLREIERRTEEIQRRVERSLSNRELLELLKFQKSLIYFRTAIETNGVMMRRLERSGLFEVYPEDRDLLDDVLTENAQATTMTAISSDIMNQMMDAYASIVSNNVNDVLRVLALATILLNVPVVLASLYGMNVPLPGQDSDGAFAAILALAGTLMSVTAFVFWRRRWL